MHISITAESYSKEKVMSRTAPCELGILSFVSPCKVVATSFSFNGMEGLKTLTEEQKNEIYEFARSYTDKMLIIGNECGTWAVCSTIFPSSSQNLVIGLNMEFSQLWRALAECGAQDRFVVSKYLDAGSARISKALREMSEYLSSLLAELDGCMYEAGMSGSENKGRRGGQAIREHCLRLSYLTGCPIDVLMDDGEDYSETDIPLMTAFLLSVFMTARNNAPDRNAVVEIASVARAARIDVRFTCDDMAHLKDFAIEWDYISSCRLMEFAYFISGGVFNVRLHPYRFDWSVNGIKDEVRRIPIDKRLL